AGGAAGGIVGEVAAVEVQFAVDALDLQAVAPDGLEMAATRKKPHVVPGRRQARAKIPADGSRRHDRNPHEVPSRWSSRRDDIARDAIKPPGSSWPGEAP